MVIVLAAFGVKQRAAVGVQTQLERVASAGAAEAVLDDVQLKRNLVLLAAPQTLVVFWAVGGDAKDETGVECVLDVAGSL